MRHQHNIDNFVWNSCKLTRNAFTIPTKVGRANEKKNTKRKRKRNIVNAFTQSYFRVVTHKDNVLLNLG